MNLPPNSPFWGTLGLSKSLTCGGFGGRSRNVATHRFILGFSNANSPRRANIAVEAKVVSSSESQSEQPELKIAALTTEETPQTLQAN